MIRLALMLVPVVIVLVILGVAVSSYDRSHSMTAVSDRFVAALQLRDTATLRSLMTVKGAHPDASQVQAFCSWAADENEVQEIRQQLQVLSSTMATGGDSSVSAENYLSFAEKRVFLFTSYSIDVVPTQAVFVGLSGTSVTLNGAPPQAIGSDALTISSLLPGEYSYSLTLPTALGQLTGLGKLTVEPLTGGTTDVSSAFDNAAWYAVPTGITASAASLNGTSAQLQSGSGYQYVGPYPAGAYAVAIDMPAPWGTATYTGTTASSAGSSTITTTGINDATYAKLEEIAAAIDKIITNDTLLARNKLSKPGVALEGMEAGSAAYNYEKDRIQAFLAYPRDFYFLKMTLSSKFKSLNETTVEVLCEDQFTDGTVVGDFTFVYKDGKFLLRNLTSSYGWYSDDFSSPRSIVITHKQ